MCSGRSRIRSYTLGCAAPAQPWVRERLMQVSKRFRAWASDSKAWARLDGETALSDLEPSSPGLALREGHACPGQAHGLL